MEAALTLEEKVERYNRENMREVVLHGELARKYGKVHHYVATSVAEALRLLCLNHKGLEDELWNSRDRGVGYQVWVNGNNIGKDELKFQSKGKIYISPVFMGSKRAGVLQTIVGVILIVVGALAMTVGAEFGGDAWGPYVLEAGIALTAGGIAQMLAPHPKQDKQNQLQSSYFDGAVNTVAQGNPVPVGYGRLIVGGAIISGGITIDSAAMSAGGPDGTGSPTSGGGGHQKHPTLTR